MRFAHTQSHEYEIQDIENIFGGSLYVTNRWYPALLWDHENSKKEIVKITSSRLSRSVSSRWNHLQKVRKKTGQVKYQNMTKDEKCFAERYFPSHRFMFNDVDDCAIKSRQLAFWIYFKNLTSNWLLRDQSKKIQKLLQK